LQRNLQALAEKSAKPLIRYRDRGISSNSDRRSSNAAGYRAVFRFSLWPRSFADPQLHASNPQHQRVVVAAHHRKAWLQPERFPAVRAPPSISGTNLSTAGSGAAIGSSSAGADGGGAARVAGFQRSRSIRSSSHASSECTSRRFSRTRLIMSRMSDVSGRLRRANCWSIFA